MPKQKRLPVAPTDDWEQLRNRHQPKGIDQLDRAARLSGIAAALRETCGTVVAPVHRAADERSRSIARMLLGGAAYDRAWAAGKAMPLDEAVASTLADESEVRTTTQIH